MYSRESRANTALAHNVSSRQHIALKTYWANVLKGVSESVGKTKTAQPQCEHSHHYTEDEGH